MFTLGQQKTQTFPRPGAARVPKLRADWRVSVSDRYNPKAHLPHTFQDRLLGIKRCHDKLPGLPPVRIITTGWSTEGCTYREDWYWERAIQNKLGAAGVGTIPLEHIFNTMGTKARDVKKRHFHTCTGYSRLIMKSVWNKPETFRIVAEVMQTYRAFSQHAEPGEVFDAVLYCTSGCHRSVAVALLLEMNAPWAYGNNDDAVSVKIVHRSQDMGL